MTRYLLAILIAALLLPAAAIAGRVPPQPPPAQTCTRPPINPYADQTQVCASPATITHGTSTLITISARTGGQIVPDGTPLFLYSAVYGSSDLTLIGSCWTYQGGCAFVIGHADPGLFVLYGYAAGVLSGGLLVTWT